jgi:hypothetical protein
VDGGGGRGRRTAPPGGRRPADAAPPGGTRRPLLAHRGGPGRLCPFRRRRPGDGERDAGAGDAPLHVAGRRHGREVAPGCGGAVHRHRHPRGFGYLVSVAITSLGLGSRGGTRWGPTGTGDEVPEQDPSRPVKRPRGAQTRATPAAPETARPPGLRDRPRPRSRPSPTPRRTRGRLRTPPDGRTWRSRTGHGPPTPSRAGAAPSARRPGAPTGPVVRRASGRMTFRTVTRGCTTARPEGSRRRLPDPGRGPSIPRLRPLRRSASGVSGQPTD